MDKYSEETHDWLDFDRQYLWHPYTSMRNPLPTFPVAGADGVRLRLADGREIIDGMASWWTAIHGYNHPDLNAAAVSQLGQMSHVMFGGLSHEPASALGRRLLSLVPDSLKYVFFADSGSISVEVAMKMALQYWYSKDEPQRALFLTPRGGYHGDPFVSMSVSDPQNGMHHMFESILPKQVFVDRPAIAFTEEWDPSALIAIEREIKNHREKLAGIILEPIVQGAGGMWFYHPEYLTGVRSICDREGLLLIADEIATGFGRTGKMFACEHADVEPDIMCVGKAMTGGMMSLAATITNDRVVDTIDRGPYPTFMHGPTFMANPLACAVSVASIDLLVRDDWLGRVQRLERELSQGLEHIRGHRKVSDVRVLGAIGVVELEKPVDLERLQQRFVDLGVWIRPFGRLIYVMPPYIISSEDMGQLVGAIDRVVSEL